LDAQGLITRAAIGICDRVVDEVLLAEQGNIVAWDYEVWTPTHATRPDGKPGNLLAGQLVDPPAAPVQNPMIGGDRNAPHNYSLPNNRITVHWTPGLRFAPPPSAVLAPSPMPRPMSPSSMSWPRPRGRIRSSSTCVTWRIPAPLPSSNGPRRPRDGGHEVKG
jgi:hypothetical protein